MARERHRPAPFQRADSESGHGWLTSFRNRFRGRNLQSSVSKLLFMMGFLVNSLTMTVLFIWLNLSWTDLMRKNTEICLENWSSAYEYSIHSACAYFSLLSLLVVALILFMQFRRLKMENHVYFVISLLGTATFLYSAALVLSAALGILMESESCAKGSNNLSELKLRFVFQSTAAFLTSLLYMTVGVTLTSKVNQQITPTSPVTPVYQINPPGFDALYPPPPPSYQQSQRDQRRSQREQQAQVQVQTDSIIPDRAEVPS